MSPAVLLILILLPLLPSTSSYRIPTDGPSAALSSRYRSRPPPSANHVVHLLAVQYPAWHRQHRHTARRLVYTFNHTQPGLGDRFQGLFTAYIQAAFSHRVLLLQWEYPFSIFDYLTPSRAMTVRYTPKDKPRLGSYYPCTSRVNCGAEQLGPLLSRVDTILLSNSELARPNLILRLVRMYPLLPLSRALKSLQPETLPGAAQLFTEIFAAMFDTERSLNTLLARLPAGRTVLSRPFVGVHARLGEGVGESKGRFSIGDRKAVASCLASAAAEAAARQKVWRFYLATDTPVFLKMFERAVVGQVPGALVIGGGGPGPVHTCRCGGSEEGTEEKCVQTFLELFLLAKGKALVGSRSGFSEVASHIGNVSDYSIVGLKGCVIAKGKR